jgi:hypothetical protein
VDPVSTPDHERGDRHKHNQADNQLFLFQAVSDRKWIA